MIQFLIVAMKITRLISGIRKRSRLNVVRTGIRNRLVQVMWLELLMRLLTEVEMMIIFCVIQVLLLMMLSMLHKVRIHVVTLVLK